MRRFVNVYNKFTTKWEKRESCYSYDLICRVVEHEERHNRPLKSIILSRWNYDRLEKWFEVNGVRDEDNFAAPLKYKNYLIKRAECVIKGEYLIEYNLELSNIGRAIDNFEENIAGLNINSTIKDDIWKQLTDKHGIGKFESRENLNKR